jgi:hypothetical protein
MIEYFIIDNRTNKIVNCVTSSIEPKNMFGEDYYLTSEPTLEQLSNYQYYNERP